MSGKGEPMKAAHVKPMTYIGVFAVLAVVTAVEVFVSGAGLDRTAMVATLLALATSKALLVVLFYMHLKYDTKWYTYAMLFPMFMALVLTAVVLVYGLRA
jgi:cytochrome c oxidase subunit IV